MADGLSGAEGATTGSSGQTNSSLNLGADLAAETIVPTEREKAVFRSLMADTFLTTPEAHVTWILDQIALRGTPISVNQIQGFSGFQFQSAEVVTSEATSSLSYADLTTPGPTLSGLADGRYAVFIGGYFDTPLGNGGAISLHVNGSPSTGFVGMGSQDARLACSSSNLSVQTLTNDNNNTLTLKYYVSGGTTTFSNRWLTAVKYANL